MTVDTSVEDIIALLKAEWNNANVENTLDTDLFILERDDNEVMYMGGSDSVLVYHVASNKKYDNYATRGRYDYSISLAIEVVAREQYDSARKAGVKYIMEEVKRILEKYQHWYTLDATSNYHHIYINSIKNMSGEPNDIYREVMDIELVQIGVITAT